MAQGVTVSKKPPKYDDYDVQGATLAEIWNDIKAKGPKDGGKDRAGYTKAPATLDELEFKGTRKQNRRTGEWLYELSVKSVPFKMESTVIKRPKLKSEKDLSKPARREWRRFMSELNAHELEHVTVTEAEARKFGAEILRIKSNAIDADWEKAKEKAREKFDKKLAQKHTAAKLKERLDKANKKLDQGGHGPVLKTSIE